MIVGTLQMRLAIHGARSLKDKRRVVQSLQDRIRHHFNASVAEIGHQDGPQGSILGVAIVGHETRAAHSQLSKILDLVRSHPGPADRLRLGGLSLMRAHRPERVAEAIREVVGTAILLELHDPRVQNVTVTRVEVSGDLRNCKVYVSIMGAESQQQLSLRGLRHAAGWLQSKVAERLQTRWTPVIEFVLDPGVKKSLEISRLIDAALAGTPPGAAERPRSNADAGPADPEDPAIS